MQSKEPFFFSRGEDNHIIYGKRRHCTRIPSYTIFAHPAKETWSDLRTRNIGNQRRPRICKNVELNKKTKKKKKKKKQPPDKGKS